MNKLNLLALSFFAIGISTSVSAMANDVLISKVQLAAHKYIENNAPDFGGHVKSPCEVTKDPYRTTIVCWGIANETVPGDGSVPIKFKCTGTFQDTLGSSLANPGRIYCNESR